MSLLIVGSVAFDTIETPFGRRERIVGGSGTYCAIAAAYFTRPRIVAVVGRDFPEETLAFLRSRKIDLRGLEVRDGKTFHWEGRYGEDPNQRTTVRTDLNVFGEFRPRLPAGYAGSDIVYLANIDPDLHEGVLAQVRRPRLVAMDTILYWITTKPESVRRELRRVDVYFANDEEARLISGESNLVRAGRRIVEMGPRLVVLKKGEHGALLFGQDFTFGALAHPCEHVVDPTGAGDCFAGGFLGSLDRGGSFGTRAFRRAAAYGSVLASFAIEDFGIDRFRRLGRAEVESRFARFRRLTSI